MTFNSHSEYIASNSSEKIVLAHIHGSKRLYNFSLDSGTYSREVNNFVTSVKVNSTLLSRTESLIDLDNNTKYFYDINTGKLHLYEFDQDNDEVIVEFKFFLSNLPIILPWDLDNGEQVNYEPRVIGTPKFKSQMSQGKSGINLVGSGDLTINNNDGFYDSIYDTLFWENKSVNIYTYHRDLNASEAKIIFRGIITGKKFATDVITFNLNDDLYSLEQLIPSEQYNESVIEEDSTNYKRVIYGRLSNLQVQSLDKYGEGGIVISGNLSGVAGQSYITGINTEFMSELSNGDSLDFGDFQVTVDEVKSDTIIKTSELDRTFYNLPAQVTPDIQYWNKNRQFQVCGHAIKKIETTISQIISRNRLEVTNPSDFEAGDIIDIDGEEKTIRRVSGDTLVLTTNYNLPHNIGDTITKKELFNVRYDSNGDKINANEITISNSSSGTTFEITQEAEINSAKTINLKQKVTFINGSSGIWLGSPARHQITLSTGNKYGKYFTLYDVEGDSTAFWFKDTAPESSTAYQEPDHGADNSVSISFLVNNPDISTLQEAIINSINANSDQYYAKATGTNIILESINAEAISIPSTNTSGFSVSNLTTGSESNYKIDLTELIEPRDFIVCPDGVNREVLEVYEKSIKLRSDYQGTTGTFELNYKNVNYISDESTVYIDCYGKTKDNSPSGDLITTGPEAVEDILKSVGLSSYLNTDSFTDSSIRAPQLISMAIPYSLSDEMPSAKDVINKINKSVIGSLFVNNDLMLGYDILDSEIPLNALNTIGDEDVLKWSVSGDSFDVVKKVIGNYRFVDYKPSTDTDGSYQVSYESDFVTKYVGNENTKEVNLYLYNKSDAQEMVERDQFINSLSNSTIKIKGSLNLSQYNLGERVLLNLNRLYVALGSSSNTQRVGVISSIKQTGETVEMEIEDVGAIYSRSARITDDSAPDYVDSSEREKVINSFIVGDNEIIDTKEDTFSTNLIS